MEEALDRAGAVLRARAPGLRAGPHRRRRPAADPSRPGALRRALRQPRGVAPPVDRRARDAGHRRLPPTRLAGPDLGAARGQRGRRDPPARAAGLHRGGGPRRRSGPAGAVRDHRPLLGAARARLARPAARRSRTSCPGPRSPGDLRAGPAVRARPRTSRRAPTTPDGLARASASRRSWPGPGSGRGGPARSSSPPGGSPSTARWPRSAGGSTRRRPGSRSTACWCRSRPVSSTTS